MYFWHHRRRICDSQRNPNLWWAGFAYRGIACNVTLIPANGMYVALR